MSQERKKERERAKERLSEGSEANSKGARSSVISEEERERELRSHRERESKSALRKSYPIGSLAQKIYCQLSLPNVVQALTRIYRSDATGSRLSSLAASKRTNERTNEPASELRRQQAIDLRFRFAACSLIYDWISQRRRNALLLAVNNNFKFQLLSSSSAERAKASELANDTNQRAGANTSALAAGRAHFVPTVSLNY